MSGVFLASVIPNPKEIHSNEKEEVEEFTINEARELDLENIPLSLSHEDQIFTKVGYVNKQFEFGNQQKDLMVTGVFGTDTDSFYGITGLLRKQYKDVSLQHLMTKYVFSDNNYHITKKPIELSLCEEGRRYGSSVYLLFTDCFDSGIIERDQKIHIYACPSNLKKFNKRGKIKKKY